MFKNILIICTGNICRSPMAEALFKAKLPSDVQVSSAGIAALIGAPADPLAVEVMREQGFDISAHRGRQVLLPYLTGADLVLGLDQSHTAGLLRQYPVLRGRVHKLLQWRGNADVADPYGQDKAAFQLAYEHIAWGVDDWLQRIAPGRRAV